MSKSIELIIGGDLFPNETNEKLFIAGTTEELVGTEIANKINSADFRIFNLEGALTNLKSPISKSGPIISAAEESINGIKKLKTDLLVLSNNHILDEGQIGIERTISVLNNNKISYIGIGKTEKERRNPFIFEKDGIKVGIYNCCEHEFSITEEGFYGANPYDPLYVFDDVRTLNKNCDFVIVLFHGGKEYIRYPSPNIQRIFRKFAECGANAVIAQHTHCIGSDEEFNNSLLLYGQGNFLFDTEISEFTNTGLLIKFSFYTDKTFTYEYIPVCKNNNVTRIATDEEKNTILTELDNRSKKILEPDFLKKVYTNNATEYLRGYLLNMHIGTKIDTILLRIFLLLPYKMQKKFFKKFENKLLALLNYFNCESHRELIQKGLKTLLKVD